MNKVAIMGRLTKDVDLRHTQSGIAVANFTLDVNRRFVKQEEERKADFISCIAWRNQAEFCEKYFKKGQQMAVIGRLETSSYEDTQGKRRYKTDVIVEEIYFAGSKNNGNTEAGNSVGYTDVTGIDDDLPF